MKNRVSDAAWQYLAILSWAVWMGGFVFYFGIVVPTGGAIVGGFEQGLVTQQVTYWLNLIGAGALPLFFVNVLRSQSRILWGLWAVMVLCQTVLFFMHRRLDSLIDATARSVSDADLFSSLHESYEAVSTVMWLAAMIFAWSFVSRPALQT